MYKYNALMYRESAKLPENLLDIIRKNNIIENVENVSSFKDVKFINGIEKERLGYFTRFVGLNLTDELENIATTVTFDYVGLGENQEYTIIYYTVLIGGSRKLYLGFNKIESDGCAPFRSKEELVRYYEKYKHDIDTYDERALDDCIYWYICQSTEDHIILINSPF